MNTPAVRHPDANVIDEWADELAQKLGSTREEMLAANYIDNGRNRVVIQYEDESQAVYRNAIAVCSEERKQVAVFTEHCGYLVFKLPVNTEVIETVFSDGEWHTVSHYIQQPYRLS